MEDVGIAIRENLERKRFPRNEICRSNHTNSSTTASSGAEWNHSCEDIYIYICIYSCRLSGRDRSSRIGFSHSNLSRIRGTFLSLARSQDPLLYFERVSRPCFDRTTNECSTKKWNSIFFFFRIIREYLSLLVYIIYRFERIRKVSFSFLS